MSNLPKGPCVICGKEAITFYRNVRAIDQFVCAPSIVSGSKCKKEWCDRNLRERVVYREFIKSDAWRKIRKERFEIDGYECRTCGTSRNLTCHHVSYDNLGDEQMEDLITLCRDCHSAITPIWRKRWSDYYEQRDRVLAAQGDNDAKRRIEGLETSREQQREQQEEIRKIFEDLDKEAESENRSSEWAVDENRQRTLEGEHQKRAEELLPQFGLSPSETVPEKQKRELRQWKSETLSEEEKKLKANLNAYRAAKIEKMSRFERFLLRKGIIKWGGE